MGTPCMHGNEAAKVPSGGCIGGKAEDRTAGSWRHVAEPLLGVSVA